MSGARGAIAIAALAAASACATADLPDPAPLEVEDAPPNKKGRGAPSPSPSSSGSGDPSPAPSPTAPPVEPGTDAGAQARRWRGTLGATARVTFGGGQHCTYRVTLKNVAVDVTAAANGDIVAANVTALAVEEVLSSPCSNAAIPAGPHRHALALATILPSGASHLELVGGAANHPSTSLVIEGDFRAFNPQLALRWHRTDFGPPLDWTVNAYLTVLDQP